MENGASDYVLRYDPESAALIDEDVSQAHEDRAPADQVSWTETTFSEERSEAGHAQADAQEQTETNVSQPRSGHGNSSS
jgi:hypothetical protein